MGTSIILALQPGTGNSADFQITGSGTMVGRSCENLGGMHGVNLQLRFALGTGSGGVAVFMQTSLDEETTWFNSVVKLFDASSDRINYFIRPATSETLTTPVSGPSGNSPEPQGIITSILGDRLRLYVVVAGSYQNTVLSARVLPIF